MERILKIDNFEKNFPTKYGLDSDGSCYEVITPFKIEILSGYTEPANKKGINYRDPIWEDFTTSDGDVILSSKNGAFIILKNSEGYIDCRPARSSNQQEPNMDTFPKDSINKIGKDLYRIRAMSFEDRKKITTTRGL